jgi:hypothetical protein
MRIPHFLIVAGLALLVTAAAHPQTHRRTSVRAKATAVAARPREVGSIAHVIDETLSVLRQKPSLFAEPIQRMRRGRMVKILGMTEADGVKFYKVAAPPSNFGWVQADAVFGKFRTTDEERLARLVQAADGFDQIELASLFFEIYPDSKFQPSLLLLYGDVLEETAVKMTRDASNRLSRREMAASAAPLHSYYLNFVSIDRYRKLGIVFLFNSGSRSFHYDGASWKEIVRRFAASAEAVEAQKRLNSLKEKMERKPVSS